MGNWTAASNALFFHSFLLCRQAMPQNQQDANRSTQITYAIWSMCACACVQSVQQQCNHFFFKYQIFTCLCFLLLMLLLLLLLFCLDRLPFLGTLLIPFHLYYCNNNNNKCVVHTENARTYFFYCKTWAHKHWRIEREQRARIATTMNCERWNTVAQRINSPRLQSIIFFVFFLCCFF